MYDNNHHHQNEINTSLSSSISLFCVQHLPLHLVVNAVCDDNCIALVLIDNSILLHYGNKTHYNGHDDNGDDNNGGDNNKTTSNDISNRRYVGHYVLLCGISKKKEHLDIAKSLFDDGCHHNDDHSRRI